MVGDELEAAHQFVSPAKYFAAARRMSRSLVNVRSASSNTWTRTRSRTTSCSGDSSGGGAIDAGRDCPRIGAPAA